MNSVPAKQIFSSPVHLLAFGFGSGLAPKAPGTFGTLAAVPIYLLIAGLPPQLYLGITAALLLAGIYLCGKSAELLAVHDHPGIVWDEIVGYLITMSFVPSDWKWIVAGFVLFRFFDILKPWPIRSIDRGVDGGLGIMLDDVIAGLFAAGILQLMIYSLPV